MLKYLFIILVIIFSILFFWQNIIFNFDTHLRSWLDELFIIWIYQNNIAHFTSLDFRNIYETNAIYPFKYTLSFAEHMYFPSLLILLISSFTKNIIAQYNILLVLNHVLIFLASLLFFKKIFKNISASLISAFYTTFSPYLFIKIGHFQMLFFWPMFLSLYFLADYFEREKRKALLLSAVFTGIQFLSSIYIGVMTLAIIFIWFFVDAVFKKIKVKKLLINLGIFSVGFFIISFVSIYGYLLVNWEYKIQRDYSEYVTYSAHLTDYLFPPHGQYSTLYTTSIFQKIEAFNHHTMGEFAVSAGILPLVFAFYILFPKIRRIKESINVDFNFSPFILLALILILTGFILSLGPRLFVNGQYTEIPLPYDLFLKIFSPIGIMRAVARWHFLLIFGFSILLGLGYMKLEEKIGRTFEFRKTLLLISILFLLFLEFYSLKPIPTSAQKWGNSSYQFLKSNVCTDSSTTLLEYPFHYRNLDGDIVRDVNYMATILLNSTLHDCKILSGYYGYEPPEYIMMREEFANGFDEKDVKIIMDLNIDYIKFNKFAVSDKEYEDIKQRGILEQFKKIYEDSSVLILQID